MDAYTPIPNHILDNMSKMKGSVFQVVCAVARKTAGWSNGNGGRREWDKISTSQFCDMTGLSNRAVINAITEAINDGWIERKRDRQQFCYRVQPVNFLHRLDAETYEESSQVDDQTYEESSQEPMKKVHTQKKGKKDHQKKTEIDLAPPAAEDDSDKDGRWLKQKIDSAGFVYKDRDFTRAAMQLEQDYSIGQLQKALDTTQEAHRKQIRTGKRGITAPLAYMRQVLLGMSDEAEERAKSNEIDLNVLLQGAA